MYLLAQFSERLLPRLSDAELVFLCLHDPTLLTLRSRLFLSVFYRSPRSTSVKADIAYHWSVAKGRELGFFTTVQIRVEILSSKLRLALFWTPV